jgi:CubicO group peptidase (beta-lactamase class C family)
LALLALAAVAAHARTWAAADRQAARRAPTVASAAREVAWPQAAVADPTTLGFTKIGLAALEARLQQSVDDSDTAGMTVLLQRRGQIAFFKSFGRQTPDTPMANDSIFRIYSMSKPITGVAMMQLYEQGKWQLDEPITKYAPELASLKQLTWQDGKVVTGADGAPVLISPKTPPTMRQLMSHTAGFGYGLGGEDPVNRAFRDQRVLASNDLDTMMKKIAGIPLFDAPGARWYYSVAVDIQGYLVQKLSGMTFGDYLKAHVTGPIGMTDTAFYVTPDRKRRFTDVYRWDRQENRLLVNPARTDRGSYEDPTRLESGGGGLVSTAHDYARFCQMLLNQGEIGGLRILKPETVRLMAENHIGALTVGIDGTQAQPGASQVRFGLDFAVHTDPHAAGLPYGRGTYYWGGAAGTWFWIDPVNDLAFTGMIQMMGGYRPNGFNFRGDSARLVYAALVPATRPTAQ